VPMTIDRGTLDRLKTLAREHRVTLAAVLLAGYAVFLGRMSGQEEIVIGMPVSGRDRPEWTRVIGYFVNMLPIRLLVAPGSRFTEHLSRSADALRSALANREFPFPIMVESLKVSRHSGQTPVFQAVLNVPSAGKVTDLARLYDPDSIEAVRFGPSLLTAYPLRQQEGQFEISVELFDAGDRMVGRLKYRTDLFDRVEGQRLAHAFERILDQIAANPEACVGAYSIPSGLPSRSDDERDILSL